MSEQYSQDDVIPHGEAIVERFGGIRPMASKLNVPVTTVQGWKKRDAIPAIRREEILSAAAHYDIDLKGLLGATANQNTRSGIAEDPALAAAPSAPQVSTLVQPAAPTQQATRARAESVREQVYSGIDMRQVRRSARRTSLITTVCVLALVGGAAMMLFAPSQDGGRGLRTLEQRVAVMEKAQGQATAQPAMTALEARVNDLSAVMGNSAQGLRDMARNITAGQGTPLLARLAQLETQITQSAGGAAPALSGMIDRMQGMAQTPQGAAEWQAAIADLRNIVTGMQGQTSALNTALVQAQGQNDALGRTLQDVSARDLGAAAMLLTLSELRGSIDRQTPFADDLELLRQVAGSEDAELAASIDRLAPYAASGVLSSAGLKRELQASANDIITAKIRGEDVSMKDKVMGRLQGLFSVKKDGVAVSGSREEHAVIERASAQLDAGDVAGAMTTLNTLEGAAKTAAAPWEAKAQANLAAQALDGQLVQAISNKIKGGLAMLRTMPAGGVTAGAAPINMNTGRLPAPVLTAPATQAPATATPEPTLETAPQTQATPVPQAQAVPGVPSSTAGRPTVTIQQ